MVLSGVQHDPVSGPLPLSGVSSAWVQHDPASGPPLLSIFLCVFSVVFLVLCCVCIPACFCFEEADIRIILRKSICFSVLQVTYNLIFHCVFQTDKPIDVIWIAH